MILEAIALGYLAGDYVYHRWIESHPPPPNPSHTITVPTAQEGMSIPMIYGRVLVKAPIMAFVGNQTVLPGTAFPGVNAQYVYGIDIHLVVGIFPDNGTVDFFAVWNGATVLGIGPYSNGPPLVLVSNNSALSGYDAGFIGGLIEILPGDAAQDIVALGSKLSARMHTAGIPYSAMSSYRGVYSIFLTNTGTPPIGNAWWIGGTPNPGIYSVEVFAKPLVNGYGLIGLELNPIDILLDLLAGTGPGKLGIPRSKLDMSTFNAAAATLATEKHGMSRSWEDNADAKTRINEISQQVDGVMRFDPVTGLHSFKLIRADFDPSTCPEITPANCRELQNFAAGGWVGLPNDIYVNFTDRSNSYNNGSGRAQSQAAASGQSGEVVTVNVSMPGICTKSLADAVAARELQARSRPIAKCRAIVNRSFLRVLPGDAVKLTWPEANIAGVIFRVAGVNRGTLENPTIALDLLQDYFFTFRNVVHPPESGGGGTFGPGI